MYKNEFKLNAGYFHFLLLVILFLFLDFDQRQRHSVCERHYVLQSEFTVNVFSTYDSFSDVGESQVWFASKNLTPCRMH